jgi:SRSO17 transposase
MLENDFALSQRLEQFLKRFRGTFRRREQLVWAIAYMQGLLHSQGRKTSESLARTIPLPSRQHVDDAAQALQHFINQSPWDEDKLWSDYQGWLAGQMDATDGTYVLEEFVFRKQGRHSVGVQRQYSAALARKINCQIAVGLHYVSPSLCGPLRLRLYLPRNWLESRARLAAAGVPESARRPVAKAALALELLDAALLAGLPACPVAPGCAWGNEAPLAQAIEQRGLIWLPRTPLERLEDACNLRATLLDTLGLDHFEGRSWRGFHHHACLVMLARAFLAFQSMSCLALSS